MLSACTVAACGDGPAEPVMSPPAWLVLEQRLAADSPLPVEGAFGFFALRGAGDQVLASGSVPTTEETTLLDRRLPAGDYTVVAYQRPCAGDCRRLDPPTGECEDEVSLEPGARLTAVVTVSFGEPCTIRPR